MKKPVERLKEWYFWAIFAGAIFLMAVILYWQERSMFSLTICPLCGTETLVDRVQSAVDGR